MNLMGGRIGLGDDTEAETLPFQSSARSPEGVGVEV
jgi:hypothetical protein